MDPFAFIVILWAIALGLGGGTGIGRWANGRNVLTGKPRLTHTQLSARRRARAEIAAAKAPRDRLPSGLLRLALPSYRAATAPVTTEADKWRADALAALKPEDVRWLAATGWEPPIEVSTRIMLEHTAARADARALEARKEQPIRTAAVRAEPSAHQRELARIADARVARESQPSESQRKLAKIADARIATDRISSQAFASMGKHAEAERQVACELEHWRRQADTLRQEIQAQRERTDRLKSKISESYDEVEMSGSSAVFRVYRSERYQDNPIDWDA